MLETRPDTPPISSRELEVARAYTGGKTYRQIAEDLHIAPATVRTHINNIYRKLGVTSKIELLHSIDAPSPARPKTWRGIHAITAALLLVMAALVGAVMMTARPQPAIPVPPMPSIALVAFQHDGVKAHSDTLMREMIEGLSARAELILIVPSNSLLTLTREDYARRLSNGINTRFVLIGKTASRSAELVASAALYDRSLDQIIWQDEARSPERNSLAIRLALLDSLYRSIDLPASSQRARCMEMVESDTHVYKDGAPAPVYWYQVQPRYCGPDETGPR